MADQRGLSTTAAVHGEQSPLDVASLVDAVQAVANDLGREDLARRLAIAAGRVRRPATIVCVVGEFKQGKSSLVNALLGLDICPIDDDIATSAITLLRYGPEPLVEVRRRADDAVVVEQVEPRDLADWVSERGNPDNVRCVERVDISLPHPLLANGLALVDTPGMGGLGAGHAAATLAFLPFADGVIFVTDASAELSAPEAEFLARAAELCPNVLFALTKTDLYPAWRHIAAIDQARGNGTSDARPLLPVSAMLCAAEPDAGDESLDDESGIPELLTVLDSVIVAPAKVIAAQRAAAEAETVLDQLDHQLRAELAALDDPARVAEVIAGLDDATKRLEQLRGPGARWSIIVADQMADLSNTAGHQFRKAVRDVSRDIEDAIELLKTPADWDVLGRRLQTEVAEAVTKVFVGIESGAQATRDAVVALIGDETLDVGPLTSRRERVEMSAMWTDKGIDEASRRGVRRLGSTMVGLRGAQSGVIMFGMLGQFLPAGAAALMLSNPVTLGIGAVFAGVQLKDAHKRKIALRRQQARTNVRVFLDEVQFVVGNELNEVMRSVQRALRDEFTDRITELLRTYTAAAQNAQRAVKISVESAPQRIELLRSTLTRSARLRSSLTSVGAT